MMLHFSALFLLVGPSQNTPWPQDALARTLDSLDRALTYFQGVHHEVNLDAILGTRLVEGQLSAMLTYQQQQQLSIPAYLHSRVQAIVAKANLFSTMATTFVRKSEPHYYRNFSGMITADFWKFHQTFDDDVDFSLIVPEEQVLGDVSRDTGDWAICFQGLLGTQDGAAGMCQISENCRKGMTSSGYTGYTLAHQVIFWQMAWRLGCVTNDFLPEVDHLTAGFCANLYNDARQLEEKGFPEDQQDIFMEIAGVCGVLGYRTFFKPRWLQPILESQFESGCWGGCSIIAGCRLAPRMEKDLEGGCLSHKTAVGVFALSQFVRYLIETGTTYSVDVATY